ncbi:MAG: hypothetical protein KI785_02620, partial [Devosiaceae bacterium]|nr:hypothetical protein [Devosiaceae bacterium MH13]
WNLHPNPILVNQYCILIYIGLNTYSQPKALSAANPFWMEASGPPNFRPGSQPAKRSVIVGAARYTVGTRQQKARELPSR